MWRCLLPPKVCGAWPTWQPLWDTTLQFPSTALSRYFASPILQLRMQVRTRMASLAAALAVAAALTSPALRPRHRDALAAAAGTELRPDEPGTTLRRLLEAGILSSAAAVGALVASAEREAALEAALAVRGAHLPT